MSNEHVDALIIGGGLSGVGAACHLRERCPGKSIAILESRDAIGGTWDLFRYPGIRSDSDMFTLGYSFKPWEEAKAIADGPSIRTYIRETARERGIDELIRFNHRGTRAEWSSDDQRWTVDILRTDTEETTQITADFVFACTGYYDYDKGYSPEFPGVERFEGDLVHPQHWPEDLDYTGKRVLVIGSGATAVTLVPAMAGSAGHVTMLQRSPSYVLALPGQDAIADLARKRLPKKLAYALVRWKNVLITTAFFQLSRRRPRFVKRMIRSAVKRRLPEGYDVDKHFTPRYDPWDQRMCLVPDGDLFRVLREGRASVVTDTIETFTEKGVKLASGQELEADVVVTATGLNMLLLGGMTVVVDGHEVVASEHVAYKGMMLSSVPNMAMALGYTNASWTLKCDLVSEYVCRLINHMDANGYKQVTPVEPHASAPREPIIDLKSGYVLRSLDDLPKQGADVPWRLHQNYARDIRMLRRGDIEDESISFSRAA